MQPAPAALAAAYSGITDVVADLDDLELLLPSGCRGWSIADLLLHVTLDAQRALVALATPAEDSPDVDFVSYWQGLPGDSGAALAHGQWVRRTASAYDRPSGIVTRWMETSGAAVRAAARADPAQCIATQGHVLTVPDFLTTLVTEAVIHHLDAIVSQPGAAGPGPSPVTLAMATLEGLAAPSGWPAHWSEREALLKASGRMDLNEADRHAVADRFPLLG